MVLPEKQESFEVGSGTYHWSIPFAARHVSLDSPLVVILDDEAAWNVIVQTMTSVIPGFSGINPEIIRNALKGHDNMLSCIYALI